jgi:hypothetical protein
MRAVIIAPALVLVTGAHAEPLPQPKPKPVPAARVHLATSPAACPAWRRRAIRRLARQLRATRPPRTTPGVAGPPLAFKASETRDFQNSSKCLLSKNAIATGALRSSSAERDGCPHDPDNAKLFIRISHSDKKTN